MNFEVGPLVLRLTGVLLGCHSVTESGCMWSYKRVGQRIGNLGQF